MSTSSRQAKEGLKAKTDAQQEEGVGFTVNAPQASEGVSSSGFRTNQLLGSAFSNQWVPGHGHKDPLSLLITRPGGPAIDLSFGNPHELASTRIVECFKKWAEPRDPRWFAYTTTLPSAAEAVAAKLDAFSEASPGPLPKLPWQTARVIVNTGAVAGLHCALMALLNPGDECIYFTPKWFWYQALLSLPGGVGVRLALQPPAFRLDAHAIGQAITARTRVVLLNSPHNPTGRVVSPSELFALASVLAAKSKEFGHPIWLLHDAPYIDLVFDNKPMVMPSSFYPYTIVVYSIAKVLLIPGNRIGFAAVSPHVPEEDSTMLMQALMRAHFLDWSFANSPLQHAFPELLSLPSPVPALQEKRDFIVNALRDIGYDTMKSEGTFYVWARAPGGGDDVKFAEYLAIKHELALLPGSAKACEGYFRITLSATMEELQSSVQPFRDAFNHFSKSSKL